MNEDLINDIVYDIIYDTVYSFVDQRSGPGSVGGIGLASDLIVSDLYSKIRSDIINTPELKSFMDGVPLEAMHQRERWGTSHDAGKEALDWFWLIGYLAQKVVHAQQAGDIDKALHHTISTAAALANWHAQLSGKNNEMRPGINDPEL